MRKIKIKRESIIKDNKLKQLEEEIIYLKAENKYLSSSSRKKAKTNEKVKVIAEIRAIYPLKILLKIAIRDQDDKNVDLINLIEKIYNNHKGRYG